MGEFWFLAKVFEGKIVKDSVLESKLETISERARLLYVGITRAKEYLFYLLMNKTRVKGLNFRQSIFLN